MLRSALQTPTAAALAAVAIGFSLVAFIEHQQSLSAHRGCMGAVLAAGYSTDYAQARCAEVLP